MRRAREKEVLFLIARSNDEEVSTCRYTGRDPIVRRRVKDRAACILAVQFGRINVH
jgi:hypothetical protein